ncbi:MAG: glycosyltransferase family 9 protein [Bacteroidales bacterium]|nr:glycosyltransferase family 9 protein [Bacteroidales bacterium]
MNILLSRTDSIGDVILTMPITGVLKEKFSGCKIIFLGRTYTKDIISICSHVDEFLDWDEIIDLSKREAVNLLKEKKIDWLIHVFPNKNLAHLAKKAKIKNRAGTSHRIYHWNTCNRLVSFTRKKSDLHEAQLNFKLLSPLKIPVPKLNEVTNYYGFKVTEKLQKAVISYLNPNKKNIILHPKSKGSAREWGLKNFKELIPILQESKYHIFISGTEKEAELMPEFLKGLPENVTDITGKFSLSEFIAFISVADAVVAASTGPLHIAAALNRVAVGIYPPIRPMHPGRWAPLGKNAHVLCKDIECEKCRKTMHCSCMEEIQPDEVRALLDKVL